MSFSLCLFQSEGCCNLLSFTNFVFNLQEVRLVFNAMVWSSRPSEEHCCRCSIWRANRYSIWELSEDLINIKLDNHFLSLHVMPYKLIVVVVVVLVFYMLHIWFAALIRDEARGQKISGVTSKPLIQIFTSAGKELAVIRVSGTEVCGKLVTSDRLITLFPSPFSSYL